MADCIYHDAVAVTNCPECDFAVCQACLDGGEDGMCANCTEDSNRRASAVVAEEVARCKYCHIAEDDETPLDTDGYCGTCAALPRCATHDDLIAFDTCKGCRQQFCRKCLGFNNVCEACTAKQKAAPPRPPRPPAEKAGAAKRPDGAKKGAGPAKRPDGPKPKRPRPPAADEAPKRRKKGEPELDAKGRPKKRPPSRGTQAMEAKLQAQAAAKRRPMIIAGAVVGLVVVTLLVGMFRPMSAEDFNNRIRPQMVAVHKAVLMYYRENRSLPRSEGALKAKLDSMPGDELKGLKLKFGGSPDGPGQVVYKKRGEGFVVQATDQKGELMLGETGMPLTLDESYDSGI
jgi:hypothetical protein